MKLHMFHIFRKTNTGIVELFMKFCSLGVYGRCCKNCGFFLGWGDLPMLWGEGEGKKRRYGSYI
jgi:hypothetical protein